MHNAGPLYNCLQHLNCRPSPRLVSLTAMPSKCHMLSKNPGQLQQVCVTCCLRIPVSYNKYVSRVFQESRSAKTSMCHVLSKNPGQLQQVCVPCCPRIPVSYNKYVSRVVRESWKARTSMCHVLFECPFLTNTFL